MSATDLDSVTDQLKKTTVNPKYELSFKGRGMKLDSSEDAKSFVDEISKCEIMTALRMEGNTIGVDACEEIGKALEKHPEFERALWSDIFTGRLKPEIPKALKFLGAGIQSADAHLVELDLCDNAFGPNGAAGFVDLIRSPSCYSLQELKFNNNGLGINGGKMLAQSLVDCHTDSSAAGKPLKLKVFVGGRNRLENEGATALAEAFKRIGTMEQVTMPQNGINHPGISALAESFRHNKCLKHINLNDNTFTEKGAKSIAQVLPELQDLEVINFGDCLIRTNGSKYLSEALRDKHKKLKELNLSGNEIEKSGANAIAECVAYKENLIKLDLDANKLGETGIEAVKNAMEAIGKLEALGEFSDDEGSDVDDDEDHDEDETVVEVQKKDINEQILPGVSVQDILSSPSAQKLIQLGNNRASLIKEAIGDDIKDMNKTLSTFMKISSVAKNDGDEVTKAVCECADEILEDMMKNTKVSNKGTFLANQLLVYLGVLKGEDKKYKPPSDISGTLIVLSHVVKQTYIHKETRDLLQCFISLPHPALDKHSSCKHKLLQSLYSF